MTESTMKYSVPYWIVYLLLAGHVFAVFGSFFMYLPALGFLCALFLRRGARKSGDTDGLAHASWQVNTFWISLALFIVLVGVIVGFAGLVGTNAELAEQLTAISDGMSAGSITPADGIAQLWAMKSIQTFSIALIALAVLTLVWPLKRVIHGGMALAAGLSVNELPAARRWIAFAVAVVFPILLIFCA